MYVAAGRSAHHESDCTTLPQGSDANPAPHARLERLRRDLRAAEHDHGIDRFKGNPLAPFGGRYKQRPTTMLNTRLVVTDLYSAQVPHANTTSFR